MAKIVVTGGAGYIGSHTIVDVLENGFEVISIDNLSRSSIDVYKGIQAITNKPCIHYEIDVCNLEALRNVFIQHTDIVGIIHFAAYKSVHESVQFPLRYYQNNMQSLVSILQCVEEFSIPHFVFSSSCSVYGNTNDLSVTENSILGKPECPYAATKQMGEQIVLDAVKANPFHAIILRYFNPVGAHASAAIGELPIDKPSNLVPVITQVAAGILPALAVWGKDYATRDGTCIRDYIHVMDIANAHTKALQYAMQKKQTSNGEVFNLGSGNGVSVLEAIQAFENATNMVLPVAFGPRRSGDVEAIYANCDLAEQRLGWKPQRSLHDMMASAWRWQQNLGRDVRVK